MKRRLAELCVLVGVLALGVRYWHEGPREQEMPAAKSPTPVATTEVRASSIPVRKPYLPHKTAVSKSKGKIADGDRFEPTPEAVALNRRLRVDGVGIDMTYDQVLEVMGRPERLGWEDGFTYMDFYGGAIWFFQGKVVYCSGTTLRFDETVLWEHNNSAKVLVDSFGPADNLNVFAWWFPTAGVMVDADYLQKTGQVSPPRVGLRDLTFPLIWRVTQPLLKDDVDLTWSENEPWFDNSSETLSVGRIYLGKSDYELAQSAREADSRCEVVMDAGFVRGFGRASEFEWRRNSFEESWTKIKLGEPGPIVHHPGSGSVKFPPFTKAVRKNGKYSEIEVYCEDEPLFQALRRYR